MQEIDLFKALGRSDQIVSIGDDLMLASNLIDKEDEETESLKRKFIGVASRLRNTVLVICSEGRMALRLNLRTYEIGANQMILAEAGLIAELIEMSSDLKVGVMVFSDKSQTFVPMQMEYVIKILKRIRHNPVFSPKAEMVERVRELFISMFETIREKDFQFREQAVRGYAMVLTAYGQQWISEQDRDASSVVRKETLFDRFMDLVVESRGRERKVEYYASRLCLTPKYVSEAIYMSTKRHATEWIRDYVVLEAQVLLRTPGMSVQAVSESLEFANPSFFCKYFKAATGMTPLEYARG